MHVAVALDLSSISGEDFIRSKKICILPESLEAVFRLFCCIFCAHQQEGAAFKNKYCACLDHHKQCVSKGSPPLGSAAHFQIFLHEFLAMVSARCLMAVVLHPGRFTVSGSIRSIKMYGWG